MKKVKVEKKKIVEKGTKTISEFKSFIARGNVVDLAVGVIIGGAFGKIVTSLVNDVFFTGFTNTYKAWGSTGNSTSCSPSITLINNFPVSLASNKS